MVGLKEALLIACFIIMIEVWQIFIIRKITSSEKQENTKQDDLELDDNKSEIFGLIMDRNTYELLEKSLDEKPRFANRSLNLPFDYDFRIKSSEIGVLISVLMICLGVSLSLFEAQVLIISGIFICLTSSLSFMICWLVYCQTKSGSLRRKVFNKKDIRLGELAALILFLFGCSLGILFDIKVVVLSLIIMLDLSFFLGGIEKYLT